MPTYAYACSACAHAFDVHQSFSDDALTTCPECERETLRKVFSPVGVVFKGSGFYRTDSRAAKGRTNGQSVAKPGTTGAGGSDGGETSGGTSSGGGTSESGGASAGAASTGPGGTGTSSSGAGKPATAPAATGSGS